MKNEHTSRGAMERSHRRRRMTILSEAARPWFGAFRALVRRVTAVPINIGPDCGRVSFGSFLQRRAATDPPACNAPKGLMTSPERGNQSNTTLEGGENRWRHGVAKRVEVERAETEREHIALSGSQAGATLLCQRKVSWELTRPWFGAFRAVLENKADLAATRRPDCGRVTSVQTEFQRGVTPLKTTGLRSCGFQAGLYPEETALLSLRQGSVCAVSEVS